MATLIQDFGVAPQSYQVAPSGDYKSVDPTTTDFVVPQMTRAVRVNVDVTAASGGGGVTVSIQGYDAGKDGFFTILGSALLSSVAFTALHVCLDLTASANVIAKTPVPKKIRVVMVGSGTRTTLNYSVGIDFTP